MSLGRLILTNALCVLALTANSQQAPGASSTTPKSLNEVVDGLLEDPRVQVELKITDEQRAKGYMRNLAGNLKSHLKLARATYLKSKESSNDGIGAIGLGTDTEQFRLMAGGSGMKASDLTPGQLQRGRQIALQTAPLASLNTSEVVFALSLSSQQQTRLKEIQRQNEQASAKALMSFAPEMARLAKRINIDEGAVDGTEQEFQQLTRNIDQFVQILGRVFARGQKVHDPIQRRNDARALRVLTPRQRAQLRKLQGRAFRP